MYGSAPGGGFRPTLTRTLKFGLFGRAHPDQGLLIDTRLYNKIGGHRETVADPEADLLARLGRRRILMLRSGARR